MIDVRLRRCDVQDGRDSPPREKQEEESAVAMQTTAEVIADQASKPSDDKEKRCGGDVAETKLISTKNIMFPSLSDEILAKTVDVRCRGDANKQSR